MVIALFFFWNNQNIFFAAKVYFAKMGDVGTRPNELSELFDRRNFFDIELYKNLVIHGCMTYYAV